MSQSQDPLSIEGLTTPITAPEPPPKPARKAGPGRVVFYLLVGLVLAALVALVVGALFHQALGSELPAAATPWLALASALVVALVLPLFLALRFGKGFASGLRIFAGLNFVFAFALFGLLTRLCLLAIALHGAWFTDVAGERSSVWAQRFQALATALPGGPAAEDLDVPTDPGTGQLPAVADAGPACADGGPDCSGGEDGGGGEDAAPSGDAALTPRQVFASAVGSVVYIGVRSEVDRKGFAGRMLKQLGIQDLEGHGSGFVISREGLIVTNHHVVARAISARIRFNDGQLFDKVAVLATDPANDLALLRVDSRKLKPLELADEEAAAVGVPAYAIGSPLGLDFTLTAGIVSAVRDQQQTRFVQVQTDIAPGSSGGPVLDDRGRVLGVSTAVRGPGLNLAVHARHVEDLLTAPRKNRSLATWRTGIELTGMSVDGEADPVTRAKLENVAGLAAKVLDGCSEQLLGGGGKVEFELPPELNPESKIHSDLGELADECLKQGFSTLRRMAHLALSERPELQGVTWNFRRPEPEPEDGGVATEDAKAPDTWELAVRRVEAPEPPAKKKKKKKKRRRGRRRR